MTLAGLDRVPLPYTVFEPTSPLGQVGAVLSMACPVAGLDEPEALAQEAGERLGVVGEDHGSKVGRGSDNVTGP